MTYICCSGCGRQVVASLMDSASAHAVGCPRRRSILARENYAQREKRKQRGRAAAAKRAANKARVA